MKRKLTLVTGLAVGYVAGTHAGRERYAQIKQKAHEISNQPAVLDLRENLRGNAEAATKTVAEKVTDTATGLANKLRSASGDDENGSFPFDPEAPVVPEAATGQPPVAGAQQP